MSVPKGERPKAAEFSCKNCGRRLDAHYDTVWRPVVDAGGHSKERWYVGTISGYGVGGEFCTNVCAIRYGLRAARAGVRFEALDAARVAVWKKGERDGNATAGV